MFTIQNETLKITINKKGAELSSILSHKTGIDYLWSGDPAYWKKHSPILFPIVGTLKDNTYFYKGSSYTLPRHGFARDRDFICTAQEKTSISFALNSDEQTLQVFPFPFRLDILYSIENNSVYVKYRVTNTGNEEMYFSIGAHPAFSLPLESDLDYEDYFLEFAQPEDAMRWTISREGLIEPVPIPFLVNENRIPLTRKLFAKDAIVFKHMNSDVIHIKSTKSEHGIEFHYPRFPYLGLWAAPDADFVCIEPWCGVADSTTTNQQFENKEGINFLAAGEVFERTWWVRVY